MFKQIEKDGSKAGYVCSQKTPSVSKVKTEKISKDMRARLPTELDNQHGICVFNEVILRYFDKITKDGKIWFLTNTEHRFQK